MSLQTFGKKFGTYQNKGVKVARWPIWRETTRRRRCWRGILHETIFWRNLLKGNGLALTIVNFLAGSFSLCFNSLVLYVFFKNRLLREVSHNWKTLVKMNLRASPIQPRCSSLGCFSSTTPIFINHFHILNGHFIW